MSLAIQTNNLVFAYGERVVLNRVSLSVERGEMIGIVGPNGSGKTTLLKILSAILTGKGEVKLSGRDIRTYKRRELSRLFAVVPQEPQVNFPYTTSILPRSFFRVLSFSPRERSIGTDRRKMS